MKKIILCGLMQLLTIGACIAQVKPQQQKIGWELMDLSKDGVFGISSELAFAKLLGNKSPKPIIVAVLDGSLDLNHQALKPLLWHNSKEIANNNKDDDRNGFIDDIHGWNFMPQPSKELSHASHVAGTIAAVTKGNVRLMSICTLPDDDGDELDRDDAAAIRYAVNNGAKVINISYGKTTSPEKHLVDEAVKYAMGKDVLIVHAIGNSEVAKDMDREANFPNDTYKDASGAAEAWISVGASGPNDDQSLFWPHSNYGQKNVDVFAPGVDIYSAVEGNKFEIHSGTSMAAPMVTGVAALIRAYYPKFTALQVKQIIMNSVVKREVLKDKCVSGGVINAYNALKNAEELHK